MDKQIPVNNLVIVAGVFGVLLLGMLFLQVVQPGGKQSPVATAPPANAAAAAGQDGVQNRGAKPDKPRSLQVRTELFEKCHRAFVDWNGNTDSLRKEIRLIEFKAKSEDEKALLDLFKQAASKLECKAIILALGVAAEYDRTLIISAKDKAVADQMLKTPMGVRAKAWQDHRLVAPDSDEMLAKLKKEIPDIEVIEGETTTFMNDPYTPFYISYTKSLKDIEQQILALEGAIGIGLSG